MPLIHCNFFSPTLQVACSVDLILPQPPTDASGLPVETVNRHPVLYLLHGLSDDHTIWQRRTAIERYVEGYDLAVVMPAVQRSFYTDMACGPRYWTFISEELPRLLRALFPLSAARADNFVAGLSMGGYGAFKLALTYPERYAAAASFSGALDIGAAVQGDAAWQTELRWIFGDLTQLAGSQHDLLALAERLATAGTPSPQLYQWCGTEDFLYPANLRFRDRARQLGLALTYAEGPGGHEWVHWDRQIEYFLHQLPLRSGTL